MEKRIEFNFDGEKPPLMIARFMMGDNDSVTVGGNSVEEIFFEIVSRFPDRFSCTSIGFSGDNREEADERRKAFLNLAKKFGQQ